MIILPLQNFENEKKRISDFVQTLHHKLRSHAVNSIHSNGRDQTTLSNLHCKPLHDMWAGGSAIHLKRRRKKIHSANWHGY